MRAPLQRLLRLSTLGIALGLALFLAAFAQMAANEGKPIQVQVTPRIGFAPASVRVFVRIAPDDSDRWLSVEAESAEGMSRSSRWTLEGAGSAKFWRVDWRDVSAGDYVVSASVGNALRTRARVSETVQLIGR